MQSRRRSWTWVLAAWLATVLAPCLAHGSPSPAHTPRRPVPDYDGRGTARAPVAPTAWVGFARVVLAPLYAFVQYGVRIPLGLAVPALERAHLASHLQRGTSDRTPGLSIAPTLVLDVGFVTAVGVTVRWHGALDPHNALALRVASGGRHVWDLRLADRYVPSDHVAFELATSFRERDDWTFHGLGPSGTRDAQRFDWGRLDTRFTTTFTAGSHLTADLVTGVRFDHFDEAPRIVSQTSSVPGYDNHTVLYDAFSFALDSRPIDRATTTGVRLAASGELAGDVDALAFRHWAAWQIEAGVFVEVKHPGRVIVLHGRVAFADPLGGAPVPFVDLPTLGGFDAMRAFRWGRFRGESSIVAALEYRYPVWYLLDGCVFAEAGNAFGHHLGDFEPAHLHGSVGLGFRSTGSRDRSVDVVFALGTSRFDEPFAIESARIAIGLDHGF